MPGKTRLGGKRGRGPIRNWRPALTHWRSAYKIHRYVHIVEEFPMTVTGKVRKVEMRDRSVQIIGLAD